MKQAKREKGSMLLISLAVLGLLALYGVVFFQTMSAEKATTSGFILNLKAESVAKAGIEAAISNLRHYLQYERDGSLRNRPWDQIDDEWRYPEESFERGLLLERATKKEELSFPNSASAGIFSGEKQDIVYSGDIGEVAKGLRGFYRLKVLDANSMLWLNAPNKENTVRMFSLLLKKLQETKGLVISSPLTVAQEVLDRRPDSGFKTKRQVLAVLELLEITGNNILGAQAREVFDRLQNYITVQPWVDTRQILPFHASQPSVSADLEADLRNFREGQISNINSIVFEPRAPININTASPEVLFAILANLRGVYYTAQGAAQVVEIEEAEAWELAKEIVKQRRDPNYFNSMQQLLEWLQTKQNLFSGSADIKRKKIDLLFANLNPNVNLNKFHPDRNNLRTFDKTDLAVYSTEVCFHSMGMFEITSYGMLVDPKGYVRGQAKILAATKVFEVYRDTTQADFESDRKATNLSGTGLTRAGWRGTNFSNANLPPVRHVGLISLPEFSNARYWFYTPDGELELRPINQMCNFDGQLIVNGLTVRAITVDDFAMGFVRNDTAGAGFTKSLNLLLRPNNVAIEDNMQPLNSGRIPSAVSDGSETVFSFSYFRRSIYKSPFMGSDLLPLGVVIEEDRGRYYQFNGEEVPRKVGTIEFWIKPLVSVEEFAEAAQRWEAKNPGKKYREYYFYWGTGQYTAIAIWREYDEIHGEVKLKAFFYLGWTGIKGEAANPSWNMSGGGGIGRVIQVLAGFGRLAVTRGSATYQLFDASGRSYSQRMFTGNIEESNTNLAAAQNTVIGLAETPFSELNDFYNKKTLSITLDPEEWKAGTWHHVLITYGNFPHCGILISEGRLYVDGKPADEVIPFPMTAQRQGNTIFPLSYDQVSGSDVIIRRNVVRYTVTLEREVPEVDENGNTKTDQDGNPIMKKETVDYTPEDVTGVQGRKGTTQAPPSVGSPSPYEQYPASEGWQVAGVDPIMPPAIDQTEQRFTAFWQDGNSCPVLIGARLAEDGISPIYFANAIFDNIIFFNAPAYSIYRETANRRFREFSPPSRYNTPNDFFSLFKSFVFLKRLYQLEKQDIQPYSIMWTVYPSETGSYGRAWMSLKGATSGDLPPAVGSVSSLDLDRLKGGGYCFKADAPIVKIAGKSSPPPPKVYYLFQFDAQITPSLPVNSTPILDDVTIGYFMTPEVKSYCSLR